VEPHNHPPPLLKSSSFKSRRQLCQFFAICRAEAPELNLEKLPTEIFEVASKAKLENVDNKRDFSLVLAALEFKHVINSSAFR